MATYKQYEKKNGTKAWQFRAYLGKNPKTGKDILTTRQGFKTKKEAQLAVSRLQVEYEKGEFNQPKNESKTFQEIFDLWKENYKHTVKESTYVKAMNQYKVHILPVFGQKKIDEITVTEVQKFANKNVKKFVKYRDFITDISRIFEFAIRLGIVDSNPTQRITVPKRKESVYEEKRLNYYTKEELAQFLECSKEQQPYYIYTFFQLLSASGCRQGELLGLEWDSVDFENECIHIVQTLARGENRRLYLEQPKTNHSKRTISLDDETIAVLKQWKMKQKEFFFQFGLKLNNKRQLVFPNMDNEFLQLSKPRKWMLQNIKKNNLREITIHGFRHTHATLLLEAGVEPKTISERLGHTSTQITNDLYAHVTKKMEKEVPKVFQNIINS
ncbi:site-specific integrase [Tetragenococcus koreensis]|uniref:site-specific integrase n=1 Tax=Tetragenococcus koreensis TaxID=290335 RepID=UPI001F475EF7|nr:site-specific integrase [Tetragenococcus koreensis]MDN6391967.1 site-specific integrase [Lactococcus lactis]MCF1614109.1 site-specific integrase [Tetragenococcus koreensis]MCF1619282.1 site-specific integrase [Tetragenococcus koreensis]MCF1623887.1 site-specific integrase [Tetragenococcus koreensis]MCF1656764.1 site-specific integrase [Tetragenococcus koreensis]